MQLPDDRYPAEVARPLLAEVAEQVEEFSRRGYGFILVGERDGLAEALALLGVAVPDRIVPASAAELREFLAVQPVPSALAAVPVIVMSGIGPQVAGRVMGAVDFLNKPVDPEEIARQIQHYLAKG